jgi:hypothetical protein
VFAKGVVSENSVAACDLQRAQNFFAVPLGHSFQPEFILRGAQPEAASYQLAAPTNQARSNILNLSWKVRCARF